MPRSAPLRTVCVLALLGLGSPRPVPAESAFLVDEAPPPAVVALHTAASATASDLRARAADLPGRAQLGGLRLGAAARSGVTQALPDSLLDPLRSSRDTASAWYANTRQVVYAASTMRDWVARTGGVRDATSFVLDAAATAAVAVFALVWALRIVTRSRKRRPGRWEATDLPMTCARCASGCGSSSTSR